MNDVARQGSKRLLGKAPAGNTIPFSMYGRWTSFALACGAVVAATLLSVILVGSAGTVAAAPLAVAVLLAALAGRGPGFVAVGLALASYDFFFVEPRYSLTIFSREDGVALIVFVMVALLTGTLVHSLRQERSRGRETFVAISKLVAGLADIKRQTTSEVMKRRLAAHLSDLAGGPAIVVDRVAITGDLQGRPLAPEVVDRIERMLTGESGSYFLAGWSIMSISVPGGSPIAAVWRCADGRVASPTRQLALRILGDFSAQAIARAELFGSRAEATATAEPVAPSIASLRRAGAERGVAADSANKDDRLGHGKVSGDRPGRRLPTAWIGAGVMAAAGVLAVLVLPSQISKPQPITFATSKGERRNLVLADGTQLALNTASRVSIRLSRNERRVDLLEGEAAFDVKHDSARPFVVASGGHVITDLGTEFDVLHRGAEFSVAVTRGVVEVQAAGERGRPVTRLSQGQMLATDLTGGLNLEVVDPAEIGGWRRGRLVLRDRPLSAVVTELNAYFTTPVRLADPALAERRISGVLMIDNEGDALRQLGLAAAMKATLINGEYLLAPTDLASSKNRSVGNGL